MLRYGLFYYFVALSVLLNAQEITNSSDLQLPEIMKGYDYVGHVPENIRWSMDGSEILFDWNPDNNEGNSPYAYNLKTGKTNELTPEYFKHNGEHHSNELHPIEYYNHNGALYSYNRKTGEVALIYSGTSSVRNIDLNTATGKVYFQTGNDLFAYDIKNKGISLIFSFKQGTKRTDEEQNDHWTEEELELFEFHKEAEQKDTWNKQQKEIWEKEVPEFYYGKKSVSNIQVSPDGNYITFRINDYPETKKTHVEHHISKDGHTYASNARAKVSDKDPNHQLGIYSFEKDSVYFAGFSTLTDIRKKPLYLTEYGDTTSSYILDRKIIMHELLYSENGVHNIIDVRSYDNKDRWLVEVNLKDGKIREHKHFHDEAWIGGPGISGWNMVSGTLGWLKDNHTFFYQSEETGYSHLYTYDLNTEQSTALTSGNWEVHDAQLSSGGSVFYITANKIHPGNREFYHLKIGSKTLLPVLTESGNHEIVVSPDEKWIAVRYSYKNKPWELYLAPNKPGATLKQITHSLSEEFTSYSWYDPEVITFKASDGIPVHARIYAPKPEVSNGAAVIFVHGAGYLQNAHNWWSGYYREYMFHNMLRDNGFTVLDIDYRASKGYGRDHRTAIYRHMGGKDLSDQMDGRQFLIDSLGIDPERIGIYGGSYGGFITLMALLTEPGSFKAGAALRSVTDWYHYNHEYTSNILNYPTTDPKAYEQSSPIYFADNLQDHLIMLHGMVDDNVQFQDVVRLSQRFIELGKENWELAVYPVEAHGFKKAYSWTDEYRRIYELMFKELILNAK